MSEQLIGHFKNQTGLQCFDMYPTRLFRAHGYLERNIRIRKSHCGKVSPMKQFYYWPHMALHVTYFQKFEIF